MTAKSKQASPTLPAEFGTGLSIELLKALHILTKDGQLNQDSRRKLKQVLHLAQFIEPLLQEVLKDHDQLALVDHGAGKSYLGFILYDRFFKGHTAGHVYGLDVRADLVQKSQELSEKLNFDRMTFCNLSAEASIGSAELPERVDIVTALHACDTATDDAIRFALAKRARFVVLAPCCQAEVAAELRLRKNESLSRTALAELWRHSLHTREFGSMVTNVLRCLLLQSKGYQVTVTELVGWEHSLKNELIIARFTNAARGDALVRLQQIMRELNLEGLAERFCY